MEARIVPNNNQPGYLSQLHSRSWMTYLLAFVLRVVISTIFIDRLDGPVFFDTGEDIIVRNTIIYYEGEESLHYKFNYFPFAYLAILPGQFIYFLLPFENYYLQRLMLKLPMIFSDLLMARLIITAREKVGIISKYELFILFNPVLIYAGSVKGQFDSLPALFILLAWRFFKQRKFLLSGLATVTATLFKQYGIFISFFVWIQLMRTEPRKAWVYFLGHMLLAIPVLTITYFVNFEGMLYHAVVFHLERPPNGFSLVAAIYYVISFGGRLLIPETSALAIADGFLTMTNFLLIGSILYLGYQLARSDLSDRELSRTVLISIALFFLLNKVFLVHYLSVMVVLWCLYRQETGNDISNVHLGWTVVLIPTLINFRVAHMTPLEVQNILGEYWVAIIWIAFQLIHYLLLWLASRYDVRLLATNRAKKAYTGLQILLFINLGVQIYLATLPFGEPLSNII